MRVLVVAGLIQRELPGMGPHVLLSQRRADQSFPLLWELPGGKVEPGEAPTTALERELSEELAVQAKAGPIAEVLFERCDGFDLLLLVYWCSLAEGAGGTPSAAQVAAIRWVPLAELDTVETLPADRRLFERLARGRLTMPPLE